MANKEMYVKRIIGTKTDQNGNEHFITRWERHIGNLSFGSLKKPKNQDVIEVRYDNPNDIGNIFRGFFHGIF